MRALNKPSKASQSSPIYYLSLTINRLVAISSHLSSKTMPLSFKPATLLRRCFSCSRFRQNPVLSGYSPVQFGSTRSLSFSNSKSMDNQAQNGGSLSAAKGKRRRLDALMAEEEGETERVVVGPVGPDRPKFVLFGSSIVQFSFSNGGWGAHLADIYARKADVILRGYAGWNSRRAVKVLDQVFPKNAVIHPSLVIVYFGGNDATGPHSSGLGPHVPLPEYVDNMRKIATHLKDLSDTMRLIFMTSPPLNEDQVRGNQTKFLAELDRTNELCRKYSEALIGLCKEMDIKVIDLWNAMQKRDDWLDTCFTDGIHLSGEGSKIVVEEILKVVKEADWEPSLHWKSMPTEFSDDSPHDIVAYDGKSTINVSEFTFHREIKWD